MTRLLLFCRRRTGVLGCAFLLGCAVSLSGCMTASWRHVDTLLKNRELLVEKEAWVSTEKAPAPTYDHPEKLDSVFVAQCIGQLRFSTPRLLRDENEGPIVLPELAEPLALAIVSGLQKCQPHERVRFLVQNRTQRVKLLTQVTFTRGVAFLEPAGSLNLAFDMVRVAPEAEEEEQRRVRPDRDAPNWEDPTVMAKPLSRLIVPDSARIHRRDDGTECPLWAVFPVPAGGPQQ